MCFQRNIYLLLGRMETRRHGARARRTARCRGVPWEGGASGRAAAWPRRAAMRPPTSCWADSGQTGTKRRCRTGPTAIERSTVCQILCRVLRRLCILSIGTSHEASPFTSVPQATFVTNLVGSGTGINGRRGNRGEDNVVFAKREHERG
jgi:hypothetical protein